MYSKQNKLKHEKGFIGDAEDCEDNIFSKHPDEQILLCLFSFSKQRHLFGEMKRKSTN